MLSEESEPEIVHISQGKGSVVVAQMSALVSPNGKFRVAVTIERALIDVGAASDHIRVVHD